MIFSLLPIPNAIDMLLSRLRDEYVLSGMIGNLVGGYETASYPASFVVLYHTLHQ